MENLNKYLSSFDIIIIAETFVEKKNFKGLQKWLPETHWWKWTAANRSSVRGRASAGMLVGGKNEYTLMEYWSLQKPSVTVMRVDVAGVRVNVFGVYNREGVTNIWKHLENTLEDRRTEHCIIVGDWNARTGRLGEQRKSKDERIDDEGEKLVQCLSEQGLQLLNGRTEGDWEGEYTHVDYRSQSVIDYAAANEDMSNRLVSFVVGNRVESDHFPLELTWRGGNTRRDNPRRHQVQYIPDYSKGGLQSYKDVMENQKVAVNRDWDYTKRMMWEAIPKKKVSNGEKNDHWWTTACYVKRKEMEWCRAEARRDNVPEKMRAFFLAKMNYKKEIKEAKEKKQQQIMNELKAIQNISEAWKFINQRKKCNSGVQPNEKALADYFMTLLDGREVKEEGPTEKTGTAGQTDNEVSITPEEFKTHLDKLKERKAAGPDQLKAEHLKLGSADLKENVRMICENALRGAGIPNDWREARIHPIHKKGNPADPSNYRGISIGSVAYKLYANIITARLEAYVEEKNLLPDTQNGFRRARNGLSNVMIIDHLVQRERKRGRQVFASFIDFKAAFDTIDRGKLLQKMKKMGIPEYLIRAIADIYTETRSSVGKFAFAQQKGLRQGCPISPLLFALYISDVDKVLRGAGDGGIFIGGVKVFVLAYADDLVLLATTPVDLKEMMKTLHKYANLRNLTINAAKSKVMRFSTSGRLSKERWKIGVETVEEVKTFKYLGVTLASVGTMSAHVRELVKEGNRAVARVWSIAERKFANNFQIRMQMFHSLVFPVMTYGCEIFGLDTWEPLEATARKYTRWTMGLPQYTKNAILMDESKTEPIAIATGRRAMRFMEKTLAGPCEIARICAMDKLDCPGDQLTGYCTQAGLTVESVVQRIRSGVAIAPLLQRNHRDLFLRVNYAQIMPYRYASCHTMSLPRYLSQAHPEYKTIARFRCQVEERGMQKWRRPEDRSCRFCGEGADTLSHMTEECVKGPVTGSTVDGLLCERGRGAERLRRIIEFVERKGHEAE